MQTFPSVIAKSTIGSWSANDVKCKKYPSFNVNVVYVVSGLAAFLSIKILSTGQSLNERTQISWLDVPFPHTLYTSPSLSCPQSVLSVIFGRFASMILDPDRFTHNFFPKILVISCLAWDFISTHGFLQWSVPTVIVFPPSHVHPDLVPGQYLVNMGW